MANSVYETRLQVESWWLNLLKQYPVQDDEYSYHDTLQAHLTIRHACRESW